MTSFNIYENINLKVCGDKIDISFLPFSKMAPFVLFKKDSSQLSYYPPPISVSLIAIDVIILAMKIFMPQIDSEECMVDTKTLIGIMWI